VKPWHEYDDAEMAAVALLHEIARDPNQQYAEATKKAREYLSKFTRWEH
jgi:hypothetical protein